MIYYTHCVILLKLSKMAHQSLIKQVIMCVLTWYFSTIVSKGFEVCLG